MTAQDFDSPRRLHPLTLLYRVIVVSPGYILPFYFGMTRSDVFEWIFIISAIFMGIFFIPLTLLDYFNYYYQITDKELIIRRGYISKQQRNIPINRIQNVEISQNFLQRILGISKALVETAGGSETEGVLEFVSAADAERIKELLKGLPVADKIEKSEAKFNDENGASSDDNDIGSLDNPEQANIFSLSFSDLFKYGMLTFRPVMLIFMAWLFQMSQQFAFIPDFAEWDSDVITEYLTNYSAFEAVIFIVSATIIILLLSWIFNIFLSINKYWKFKILKKDDKLYSEYGLFSKKKSTIPLKKLQMLVLKTNIIRKKFDFYGLDIETAGFAGAGKGPETAAPFTKRARAFELAANLLGVETPEEFVPISKKAIRRAFFRYLFIILTLTGAAYWLFPGAAYLLILIPLTYYGAVIRWRHRGYALKGDYVFVKQGFIAQRISIIPLKKIQTLNVYSTFFQRRLSLASLHIDTAATAYSSEASIIDISSEEAEGIMELLAHKFNELYQ